MGCSIEQYYRWLAPHAHGSANDVHVARVSLPLLVQEAVAFASEAAQAGEPIGIVTIEDILEELLQQDIYDETDNMLRAIRSSKKDRNFMMEQPCGSSPGKAASGQLQRNSPALTSDSGVQLVPPAKVLTKET